jgi:hypothetical protein
VTRPPNPLTHHELDYYAETLNLAYMRLLLLMREVLPDENDPQYQELQQTLVDATVRLRALSGKALPDDPPVIDINAKRHRAAIHEFGYPVE